MRNKVLAIFLILIIGTTFISQQSYIQFSNLVSGVVSSQSVLINGVDGKRAKMNDKWDEYKNAVDETTLDTLPYKIGLIRLNGTFLKTIGTRNFYGLSRGVNITTDGYVVGGYGSTSTDYEIDQISSFKEYLDGKGINLLYVNAPVKYIDDKYYTEQFGGESFTNRNTDHLLERLDEVGIDYLDLRDNIIEEGIDCKTLFYRTDHHWTVPAGKWAAEHIAEKLNSSCGYDIDLSVFDEEKFDYVFYEKSWLGEQGRLISETYLPPDDYTMVEPLYETNYTVLDDDGATVKSGDFGIFINKDFYRGGDDLYSALSWHYSYDRYDWNTVRNNNNDYGSVLILTDSYGNPMAPFLSLGIKDMKVIELRDTSESIRDIVDRGNYDTVIFVYAQFEVGAHTVGNSSYRMFDLE